MFEIAGIPWSHMMTVWKSKKLSVVPETYILHQWRRNVMRSHTKMKVSYNNLQCKPEWCRYDRLKLSFNEGADEAIECEELSDWMDDKLKEIIQEVKARKASANYMQGSTLGQNSTLLQGNPQTVLDPSKGVKRGRAMDVIEDIPSTFLQENANIQASQRSITNSNTLTVDLNAPLLGCEE
ncbi:hypothetical protein Dimus_008181 [Dionaea muscipula]